MARSYSTNVIDSNTTNVMYSADTITDVKTLAERLKYARQMRGLSQTELARMIPCVQSTIGNVENGRNKTIRDITAFARALRVPADWLAEGKGAKPVASGVVPMEHPTRAGGGRRSSDYEAWPFTLSREDFHRLLTAKEIHAIDNFITNMASHDPQRKVGNGA